MTKYFNLRFAVLGSILLGPAVLLTGCEDKGPAQKAGEKFDKTIQKEKDLVDPAGPAEKAGRDVNKATGNN